MKKILLSLFVIVSVFALTACVNINFDNFVGEGVLRIENNSQDAIKAFVMYEEVDGELVEAYRNDGSYAAEGESPVSVNIKSGTYEEYSIQTGEYDIWLFMTYDKYWYYCKKRDVSIYYKSTTTVSVESGEWTLLIPTNAKSMRNMLPEVVKNQVFATEL